MRPKGAMIFDLCGNAKWTSKHTADMSAWLVARKNKIKKGELVIIWLYM